MKTITMDYPTYIHELKEARLEGRELTIKEIISDFNAIERLRRSPELHPMTLDKFLKLKAEKYKELIDIVLLVCK